MEDELIKVKGFAPAALVVEFNLFEWNNRKHGWSMADQGDEETDKQYHCRLSHACEPLINYARYFVGWDDSAREWSDYYRSCF